MADHWKSIANLLGAPGMADNDEADEAPNTEVQDTPVVSNDDEATVESTDASDGETVSEEREQQLDREQSETKTEGKAERTPEVIRAVGMTPGSEGTDASKERPASKRKKRASSSWDTLASMFGVELAPEDEPEGEQEEASGGQRQAESAVLPSGPKEGSSEQADVEARVEKGAGRGDMAADEPSSMFSKTSEESNPALEKLFKDVPRQSPEEWKPSRRVVDDVSWEDEDEYESPESSATLSASEAPAGPAGRPATDEDDFLDEVDTDQVEQAERSSRGRRRRRGRRDRDRSRRERTEETDLQSDSLEKDADWDEGPEDYAWDDSDSFEADDEVAEEVERRSSRRRRRGRQRDADSEVETGASRDTDKNLDSARPRRRPGGRGADRDVDEQDSLSKTRRGSRRSRGEERREKEGQRVEEDDGQEATKHRNIPSWMEAVQSMIEGNIANHRRNESRGRSRGRR